MSRWEERHDLLAEAFGLGAQESVIDLYRCMWQSAHGDRVTKLQKELARIRECYEQSIEREKRLKDQVRHWRDMAERMRRDQTTTTCSCTLNSGASPDGA